MNPSLRLALTILSFALIGCAHTPRPEPLRVRASELAQLPPHALREGQSIIIEIREGETIPLDISIDSDLVATPEPTPSIPLVAKRTFWLEVGRDGLHFSRDGRTFDAKPKTPGSFHFGIGATRERGVHATIGITTPKP